MAFISSSRTVSRTTERTDTDGKTPFDTTFPSMIVSLKLPEMTRSQAKAATGPCTKTATTCLKMVVTCGGEKDLKKNRPARKVLLKRRQKAAKTRQESELLKKMTPTRMMQLVRLQQRDNKTKVNFNPGRPTSLRNEAIRVA